MSGPVAQGRAEELPFGDDAFDAVMAVLSDHLRRGTSVFSQLSSVAVDRAIDPLGADPETGRWPERHRELLTMDELHLGCYLITAETTLHTGGRT